MKVLISAAEASSDIHAAQLVRSLRVQLKKKDQTLDVFGIGGPQLEKEGLRLVFDARNLLVMGFGEIIKRLPLIYQGYRKLVQSAEKEKPEVAILLDYPDFHFLVAKKLTKLGIRVIYMIPPKIWAWRKYRIKKFKAFSRVLCILPFEEQFYQNAGTPATYIGNPLSEVLPLQKTKEEARKELGIDPHSKLLLLMPGSRPSEIQNNLIPLLEISKKLNESLTVPYQVLLALSEVTPKEKIDSLLEEVLGPLKRQVVLKQGKAPLCMVAADFGILKSGTTTLEAAWLGLPHLIVYGANAFTQAIFYLLIRYSAPVGLSNLVLGIKDRRKSAFPEFIGKDFRVKKVLTEAQAFLKDSKKMEEMKASLKDVQNRMLREGLPPSEVAAREVLSVANTPVSPPRRFGVRILSYFWSLLNGILRWWSRSRLFQPKRLDARVISVGNLQVGGTGKTPVVAKLARDAHARGKKVAILIRGYRGSWERKGGVIEPGQKNAAAHQCGDEAALLHELAPFAWIGVGANRFQSWVEIKRREPQIDIVILDDGFQHWKIKKDFEIVLTTSLQRDQVLYRDFDSSIRFADLVLQTKGEEAECEYRVNPGEEKIWLVHGVGQPQFVRKTATDAGYDVVHEIAQEDHAEYQESEVGRWMESALQQGARLAMTGKDFVKCRDFPILREHRDQVIVLEPVIHSEKLRSEKIWQA